MITYYDRHGRFLGQASAVPPDAPLVSAPTATPVIPVVTAPAPPAYQQDLAQLDTKVSLSKGAILVGAIALAGLTMTLSGALLRRP